MNREIKFRAWDGSKMLANVSTGTVNIWGDSDEKASSKDCVFMQYTGLKDKNGKEIYESDKVRYDEIEYEVRWSDINGGFWVGTACPLNRAVAEDCEIIGNIYENPDLIK